MPKKKKGKKKNKILRICAAGQALMIYKKNLERARWTKKSSKCMKAGCRHKTQFGLLCNSCRENLDPSIIHSLESEVSQLPIEVFNYIKSLARKNWSSTAIIANVNTVYFKLSTTKKQIKRAIYSR